MRACLRIGGALAIVLAPACGDAVLQLYPGADMTDAAFVEGGDEVDAGVADAGVASDAPATSLADAAPIDAPQGDADGATADARSGDAEGGLVPICAAPACPPCKVDADCFLPFAPLCSPTAFFCVQCFSDTDCPAGFRCTPQTGHCAPGP